MVYFWRLWSTFAYTSWLWSIISPERNIHFWSNKKYLKEKTLHIFMIALSHFHWGSNNSPFSDPRPPPLNFSWELCPFSKIETPLKSLTDWHQTQISWPVQRWMILTDHVTLCKTIESVYGIRTIFMASYASRARFPDEHGVNDHLLCLVICVAIHRQRHRAPEGHLSCHQNLHPKY